MISYKYSPDETRIKCENCDESCKLMYCPEKKIWVWVCPNHIESIKKLFSESVKEN